MSSPNGRHSTHTTQAAVAQSRPHLFLVYRGGERVRRPAATARHIQGGSEEYARLIQRMAAEHAEHFAQLEDLARYWAQRSKELERRLEVERARTEPLRRMRMMSSLVFRRAYDVLIRGRLKSLSDGRAEPSSDRSDDACDTQERREFAMQWRRRTRRLALITMVVGIIDGGLLLSAIFGAETPHRTFLIVGLSIAVGCLVSLVAALRRIAGRRTRSGERWDSVLKQQSINCLREQMIDR